MYRIFEVHISTSHMSRITKLSSGAKWESEIGYSRAVRMDELIEISGTTSIDDNGEIVGEGIPYEQTHFILKKIEKYLSDLGSSLQDVVRTRIYVTNIQSWEDVGRAHGEFFKDVMPATSMVEISALIDPKMLVEIEVTARVQN